MKCKNCGHKIGQDEDGEWAHYWDTKVGGRQCYNRGCKCSIPEASRGDKGELLVDKKAQTPGKVRATPSSRPRNPESLIIPCDKCYIGTPDKTGLCEDCKKKKEG